MALNPNWVFNRTILDNEVQSSDSATKIVKLPLSNYLHTLFVKVKCTNGATSGRGLDMSDVVDKIEVVANGSDVIYSMIPAEIKRWNLWNMGVNIPEIRNEGVSAVQEATYPIYFGRGPVDPDYFLPCARLADLELRVTYSPTIAATSFATGTTTIAVHGLYAMGAPLGDYRGTLSHKTIKAFTSAASGDEQILIPRGNLLRQLQVYCYEAAIADGTDITRVKFELNSGERVMYDLAWNDLSIINQQENWVVHEEHILGLMADTNTLDTDVARIVNVHLHTRAAQSAGNDTFDVVNVTTIAGDRLTLVANTADITAGAETFVTEATAQLIDFYVKGLGLSHAVVLDFTKAGESQLLNTSEADEVKLTLTQGGADAAVRVSTQEVRVF